MERDQEGESSSLNNFYRLEELVELAGVGRLFSHLAELVVLEGVGRLLEFQITSVIIGFAEAFSVAFFVIPIFSVVRLVLSIFPSAFTF